MASGERRSREAIQYGGQPGSAHSSYIMTTQQPVCPLLQAEDEKKQALDSVMSRASILIFISLSRLLLQEEPHGQVLVSISSLASPPMLRSWKATGVPAKKPQLHKVTQDFDISSPKSAWSLPTAGREGPISAPGETAKLLNRALAPGRAATGFWCPGLGLAQPPGRKQNRHG